MTPDQLNAQMEGSKKKFIAPSMQIVNFLGGGGPFRWGGG